jgi:predicted metal-dependent hydrolase
MYKLQIYDQQVDLVKKKIKRINLSVNYSTGKVRVTAPLSSTLDVIRNFVLENIAWIKKQQSKISIYSTPPEFSYVDGESHSFAGRNYTLSVIEKNTKPRIDLHADYIVMYTRLNSTVEKRRSILDQWYRLQLNIKVPLLVQKYEPLMNVIVDELCIKRMKTRWGTCNTHHRRIWINLELAKKTDLCLEYIVVHEMVHLLEPSHNHRFKSLMDRFMPQWRIVKQQLNHS